MNFYNNLTSNGMFFFLIVVFLVILVLILSVVLLNKNKKLKKIVEEKEDLLPINNEKEKIEVKITEEIPVVNEVALDKKTETEEPINTFVVEKKEEVKEEPKVEIKEEKPKIEVSTPIAYQRNVLREISRKMPTSPIHIERSEYDDDASVYTVTSKIDNEIDNIEYKEDYSSPLEKMEDNYETNDSMRFASEIVSKMEEELKPSNIELTDYEKKQEEEAIISYDELQKVKDKIYNLTEEEETDEFIDELKNFRLDLRDK